MCTENFQEWLLCDMQVVRGGDVSSTQSLKEI